LHLFAISADLLHHGLGVLPLREFHDHLQRHEVHGGALDAFGLPGGLLHLVGAIGAVHIDLIGFFHIKVSLQQLSKTIKQLFNLWSYHTRGGPPSQRGRERIFRLGKNSFRLGQCGAAYFRSSRMARGVVEYKTRRRD
ncbi:Low molecular weight phosphotyrosine protein phosphatase, partial [Dysosmobacter welbionis]